MDRLGNLKRVLPGLPDDSLVGLVNEIERILQARKEEGERCNVCHHLFYKRSFPEVVGATRYECKDSGPLALSKRGIIYRPDTCGCLHDCHTPGDA